MTVTTLAAGLLRIELERHRDRHMHRVGVAVENRFMPLLASIEGDEQDPWPASPPLQQLRVERQPGLADVALLVGMAGTSHWSIAIELDSAAQQASFDVACRLRESAARLGSSYLLSRETTARRVGENIEISAGGRQLLLSPQPLGPEHPVQIILADDRLELLASMSTEKRPRTVRWKYRLALL